METQTPTQPTQPSPTAANGQKVPRSFVRPRTSITETADGFNIEVELPGVSQAGLELTFEQGELTLVGQRNAGASGDGHEAVHRESAAGDYRRVFKLDDAVDAGRIGAHLEQGLLTLTLPKPESAKPRRIEITGLN